MENTGLKKIIPPRRNIKTLKGCLVTLGAPERDIYSCTERGYSQVKDIREILNDGEILGWAKHLYRQAVKQAKGDNDTMVALNLAMERVEKIAGTGHMIKPVYRWMKNKTPEEIVDDFNRKLQEIDEIKETPHEKKA